jgi:hypothetical protein
MGCPGPLKMPATYMKVIHHDYEHTCGVHAMVCIIAVAYMLYAMGSSVPVVYNCTPWVGKLLMPHMGFSLVVVI